MDCYLFKKKYRDKIHHYQEAKLLIAFKNYKLKGLNKQQIIIFEITMLFPSGKLIILTNKNRLIKTIKTKYHISSMKYLSFSQFNTLLNSHNKNIDVLDLKKLKINIKEEEFSDIFSDLFIKVKLIIDTKNKEIKIINIPDCYYSDLNNNHEINFRWIMNNYTDQFKVNEDDIDFI